MKKMYLTVFLVILITLVFVGCHSFTNRISVETTTGETDMDEQPVTDASYDRSGTTKQEKSTQTNESTEAGEKTTAAEKTTSTGKVSSPTTAPAEKTTAEQQSGGEQPPVPAAKNEYDILRKGTYYMKGRMVEASGVDTPMEIAITPKSVYMLSNMEGSEVAVLVKDKKMYMMYPKKKAYCEISKLLMKAMGQDVDDFVNMDQLKLFEGPALSEAGRTLSENCNGHSCKVYIFKGDADTETRVYMDGTKLVRFASYSNGKFSSAYDFDVVSLSVPKDKTSPPSSYKSYSMFAFMALLEDAVS